MKPFLPLHWFHRRAFLVALSFFMALVGCSRQGEDKSYETAMSDGWTFFQIAEFSDAQLNFKAALDKSGADVQKQAEALYGLGMVSGFRRPDENLAKAREYFDRVGQIDPKGDLAAWALLAEARMLKFASSGQDTTYTELRNAYQKVIDQFPNHPAGEEAFVHQQTTYLLNQRPQEATEALRSIEGFIQNHGNSKYLGQAHFLLAQAYSVLGDHDNSLKELQLGVKFSDQNPFAQRGNAILYYTMANIAQYEVGDLELARSLYNRFLAENATDVRRFTAKLALKQIDEIEQLSKGKAR